MRMFQFREASAREEAEPPRYNERSLLIGFVCSPITGATLGVELNSFGGSVDVDVFPLDGNHLLNEETRIISCAP